MPAEKSRANALPRFKIGQNGHKIAATGRSAILASRQ
jgi:hypothetical protein